MNLPLLEAAPDYDIVWIPTTVQPTAGPTYWIFTESGVVATGHFVLVGWIVDGTRIKGFEDPVAYWAEIQHPEGPRVQ